MLIRIDESWRVNAQSTLEFDLPAGALWGQMRDWRRFLTIDPLHERLDAITPAPDATTPRGTTFLILHRVCGVGPTRRGKLLTWREGCGYAISDLSQRGSRGGFPHVCAYHLKDRGSNGSSLILGVRGVWTARWMPRSLVRLWLRWVLLSTEARIRSELGAFQRWRQAASRDSKPVASAPTLAP
jgi:hypothetical protein